MTDFLIDVRIKVNGEWIERRVDARMSLADFLRHHVGATDVHVGCEQGKCGACTVRIDGLASRGCLTLAVQVNGCDVETAAGLSQSGRLAPLQDAFFQRNALQCGFCTPGMLMTGLDLMERDTLPTRSDIRDALAGNACRCTGYEAIVDAIESACQITAQKVAR